MALDEELKQSLEKLAAFSEEEIAALERKGQELNFSVVHPYVKEFISHSKYIPDFFDEKVDERLRKPSDAIVKALTDYADAIISMHVFSTGKHDIDPGSRDSLIEKIKKNHAYLYLYSAPDFFLPLEVFILNKQIDAVQKAAAQVGVSKFTGIFDDQAEENKKSARLWLGISVVVTIGIIAVLWWLLSSLSLGANGNVGVGMLLQTFFTKALIFSFLLIIFYQTVKNYTANKHLQTLNEHRTNSLACFQTFVESTSDPKIRDTVLIQATKAIFEAGNTGYISTGANTATHLETIKIAEDVIRKKD